MVPPDEAGGRDIYGFFTPPELLYYGFGDCDSKYVFLATLWRNIFPDPILFLCMPLHLVVGISGIFPLRGRYASVTLVERLGRRCIVCEPAGPAVVSPGIASEDFQMPPDHHLLEF